MKRLVVAFVLSGCSAKGAVDPPPVPPSLTTPCAAPVALPERGLTDQDVERLWGRDRSALRACGSRQAGLVDFLTGF